MFEWIKEVVVKLFWPWFKEFAWPFIRKHLIELVHFVFDKLIENIKELFLKRTKEQSDTVNQKADEYEKMAESSKTQEEAEKLRAVAQAWREAAEYFRRESEDLKNQLGELIKKAENDVSEKTNDLNIDIDFSNSNPRLLINGTQHNLPSVPYK